MCPSTPIAQLCVRLWAPPVLSRVASLPIQGKDLPTLKDMDFLNKNERVYVGEEAKREFLEKLKRDVEVGGIEGKGPWACPSLR